ncbi:multicopper oxidase domain-containing protein [Brevibacterium daeguense]|uniref:Copper-containing nitrite reductase n=1 Tax=Brevibacterium daeguense TaxID=909936 RepID=A0ABP8EJC4_9MICO|nr:multicopper oxidase domain-containing protein [Brevibacterium daeguense]
MTVSPKPLTNRRRWHLRAGLPILLWALAAVIAVIVHRFVPQPRWLMVHTLALGMAPNAIIVWSSYFADALLRTRRTAHRREALTLIVLNLGIVAVFAGMLTDLTPLTVTGGLLVAAAALIHGVGLWLQARGALASRFAVTVRYYITAALCLPAGGWLGVEMARADEANTERLLLAHLALNLLGFVGLTVAGTLVSLWPTMLRTKIVPGAERAAAQAWWLLVIGVLLSAAAAAFGFTWLVAAGVLLYLAGLSVLSAALVREARVRPPEHFASWSVGFGMLWWIGCLVALVLILVSTESMPEAVTGVRNLTTPFIVGFLAQVLIGALSYLIPVVLGGGPNVSRRTSAVLDSGRWVRLVLVNGGGVLYLLPGPSLVEVATSLAAAAGLAAFLVLAVRAIIAATRGETAEQPDDMERAAAVRKARGGILTGLGIMAIVVAVAAALDPVAVTGRNSVTTSGGTGETTTVEVSMTGMAFSPNVIDVPAGDRLIIEISNDDTTGQVHDLTLANGAASERLAPGESATLDAGIITETTEGWCTVTGHRQMGMTLTFRVSGLAPEAPTGAEAPAEDGSNAGPADDDHRSGETEDAAGYDPNAGPGPEWEARDPRAPVEETGTVHQHAFTVTESEEEVAPGVRQELWTYNGTAPGPTLRGQVGDVFEITFANDGQIGHGIDFHASALAPDRPMRVIEPGEELTYRFTATKAGMFMYHCSALPMSVHIANGMFGAVIIEPPGGLPEVDHEFVMIQSEMYFGAAGEPGNPDELQAEEPDAVVFNGYPDQYSHEPIQVPVGERVRVWLLPVGPQRGMSFHIVGGQFDTDWSEGTYDLKCGYEPWSDAADECSTIGPLGSQTLALGVAQGGFVELEFPEAGHYPFVNHQMVDAERGASGVFEVLPAEPLR